MPFDASIWLQRCRQQLRQLLPSSCALCGVSGMASICGGCHARHFSPAPKQARCRQCAVSLVPCSATDPAADHDPQRCGDCQALPPAFDATVTAADYAPPVDQLVMALKFGGRLALAPQFAGLLRDSMLEGSAGAHAMPDWLAVVPLGPERLRQRGFNQALEVARPLARLLGVPLYPQLLQRMRDTPAQSQLQRDERQANLRNAFAVSQEFIESVRGRHVGVVDDVLTTGATLGEVAATLKRFGAARVTSLVVARTPPHHAPLPPPVQ